MTVEKCSRDARLAIMRPLLFWSFLFGLLLLPSFSFSQEVVTFPSGSLTLRGVVYRPRGRGPFPAIIYNHGSAPGMLSR